VQVVVLLVILGASAQAAAQCGSWSFITTPTPASGYSHLTASTILSSSDAWAVGYTAGGTETLTLHWGGSAWSIVPSPNPSSFQGQTNLLGVSSISTDDVWAVGLYSPPSGAAQTLAIHWDGSSWNQVPSPDITGGSSFNAVSALAADDMWAVGVRAAGSPLPTEVPLAAHWAGSTWTEVPAPFVGNRINRLYGVSALTPGDVWAVGTWKHTTSPFHILILHWDGSAWTVSPAPDPGINDLLLSVVTVASDDAWAVGERLDSVDGSQPLIMHWDGSTWTTVSLPVFPGEFNRLNAIRAAAPDDIWAAGATAEVSGGPSQALLMHWNGTLWSTAPIGPSDGSSEYFGGLALASGCDGFAVGSYVSGETAVPFIERLQDEARRTVGVPGTADAKYLSQNHPNPFNPSTTIAFGLDEPADVSLVIYDAAGRLVRTLVDRRYEAGRFEEVWDGRDVSGTAVASGVYFYRLEAGPFSRTRKMVLLK